MTTFAGRDDIFIQYRFVEVKLGMVVRVDLRDITGRTMSWQDYVRICGCQNWTYTGHLPGTSDSEDGMTLLFMRTVPRD